MGAPGSPRRLGLTAPAPGPRRPCDPGRAALLGVAGLGLRFPVSRGLFFTHTLDSSLRVRAASSFQDYVVPRGCSHTPRMNGWMCSRTTDGPGPRGGTRCWKRSDIRAPRGWPRPLPLLTLASRVVHRAQVGKDDFSSVPPVGLGGGLLMLWYVLFLLLLNANVAIYFFLSALV